MLTSTCSGELGDCEDPFCSYMLARKERKKEKKRKKEEKREEERIKFKRTIAKSVVHSTTVSTKVLRKSYSCLKEMFCRCDIIFSNNEHMFFLMRRDEELPSSCETNFTNRRIRDSNDVTRDRSSDCYLIELIMFNMLWIDWLT